MRVMLTAGLCSLLLLPAAGIHAQGHPGGGHAAPGHAEGKRGAHPAPGHARGKRGRHPAPGHARGKRGRHPAPGHARGTMAEQPGGPRARRAVEHGRERRALPLQRRAASQRRRMGAQLLKQLGDRPISSAVRQELRRHARRIARLERIRQLAGAAGDERGLRRVQQLLAREQQRHQRWLAAYTEDPAADRERSRSPRGAP